MLKVSLQPSRLLVIWIIVWGFTLMGPVWLSALPAWSCVFIDLGVLVWILKALQRHWWIGERCLSYREGRWVIDSDSEQLMVELDGEFYSNRWLTVLIFRSNEAGNMVLVVLPDSADKDELRRLRSFLQNPPQAERVF